MKGIIAALRRGLYPEFMRFRVIGLVVWIENRVCPIRTGCARPRPRGMALGCAHTPGARRTAPMEAGQDRPGCERIPPSQGGSGLRVQDPELAGLPPPSAFRSGSEKHRPRPEVVEHTDNGCHQYAENGQDHGSILICLVGTSVPACTSRDKTASSRLRVRPRQAYRRISR